MSDVVIRVENLSKLYRIGQREQYRALRDVIADRAAAAGRSLQSIVHRQASVNTQPQAMDDHIWALREVSFDVRQGEVIGIIGHNGAGKSTLLKIVSRITKPTIGLAKIRGRVGSLLEVGTGFHPELTGRENIFLNGAVLGMKRTEIERKFDEIVAFAEVEKFIDTPVKRYSSGMHMRLAFAVAAHLEPEILLVDEVLAVGDAAFQKKCLGKMGEITNEGRTILFVSHNMNAIQRLCSRSILLESGQLTAYGDTAGIVSNYLANNLSGESPASWIDVSHVGRRGTGEVKVVSVWYSSCNESARFSPYPMAPLEFILKIESDSDRTLGSIAVILYDKNGTKLVNADIVSLGQSVNLRKGQNTVRLRISELYLNPDVYVLGWWLANPLGKIYDFAESAINIEVIDIEANGLGTRPQHDGTVACHFELLEVN